MAGFGEVLGHETTIAHLKKAIRLKKVSHAYILSGEKGMGKKLLAGIFAQTLQCEEGGDEPCGRCQSCHQCLSLNQPDIIRISHEKPATIGVEDVRLQINADIQVKPYKSPYKIYIVDEAEKLSVQAQNALLKTIEEPPAYGIILLLTTNVGSLLQTILSRCVKLELKPIESQRLQRYLMEQQEIPDYQAKLCADFAQGNLGKAIRMAHSEEFYELLTSALSLAKEISSLSQEQILIRGKQLSDYKGQIEEYLDILRIWYRDVLLFKATGEEQNLIFSQELPFIREQAARSSYPGIQKIFEAFEQTKQRLDANVNFDMVMEMLLLTMKEN